MRSPTELWLIAAKEWPDHQVNGTHVLTVKGRISQNGHAHG
jgi:hypothetical protein